MQEKYVYAISYIIKARSITDHFNVQPAAKKNLKNLIYGGINFFVNFIIIYLIKIFI